MSHYFRHPVLVNPTWPSAGDDCYLLDSKAYMERVTSNPGNMVFLYALTQQIRGLLHYKRLGSRGADVSIWGCSNFIHRTRKILAEHPVFKSFQTPFVAIGLGAQAPDSDFDFDVPDDTLKWIRTIIDRSPGEHPNITVRGDYTYKILRKYDLHHHAVVLGCPSLFISPAKRLGNQLSKMFTKKTEKIAVAPGYITQCAKQYIEIERSLARIAYEYGGGYICQGPEDVIQMVRGEYDAVKGEAIAKANDCTLPELTPEAFKAWFRRNSLIFGTVPSWMEYLRTCDLVIGTRIHGTILAMQAGVPALCIVLDARQKELCETMQIPHCWWGDIRGGFDLDLIRDLLSKIDWYEFDENRRQLARTYIDFLRNNMLQETESLHNISI